MIHAFARFVAIASTVLWLSLAGFDVTNNKPNEATCRALIGIGWAVLYVAFKLEDLRGEKTDGAK